MRVDYAKVQMQSIKYYLSDYIEIMNRLQQDDKIKKYLQNLRDTNNLIWIFNSDAYVIIF